MHHTNKPDTKPAASGFFFDRYPVAYAVAAVLALACVACLGGCGPTEVQAARAVAAEARTAPIEATEQQRQHDLARMAVNDLASQLAGPRPEGISEADWEASKAAIRITQSNMKGE